MNEKEIRLRCIELAAGKIDDPKKVIEAAESWASFIERFAPKPIPRQFPERP